MNLFILAIPLLALALAASTAKAASDEKDLDYYQQLYRQIDDSTLYRLKGR